ncbi:MAG: ribosome silencing factor [Planctomycetota bacterium]
MDSPRDSLTLAKRCADLLDEKKLQDIKLFHVAKDIQITDYFVIASGLNTRHLRAASDHLLKEFRENGVVRSGMEGYGESGWILIDFDDVVVHLFGGMRSAAN